MAEIVEQDHEKRLVYEQALDSLTSIKNKLAPGGGVEPSCWFEDALMYQSEYCESGYLSILEDVLNLILSLNNSLNVNSPLLPPPEMVQRADEDATSLIKLLNKNAERIGCIHIEDDLDNLQYYLNQLYYEMED